MASQEIIAYSQATTYRQLLFANSKLQFEQFHQQNSTFFNHPLMDTSWTWPSFLYSAKFKIKDTSHKSTPISLVLKAPAYETLDYKLCTQHIIHIF